MPERAAALVKASGYHGEPVSLLYPNDIANNVAIAPGIQQSLQQIGLNVTLRGATGNSVITMIDALTGHQLSIFDYGINIVDGYDIYGTVMACGVNGAGFFSGAHYCDPTADNFANKAEALPLGAERDAAPGSATHPTVGQQSAAGL